MSDKIEFKVEDKDYYVCLPSARNEKNAAVIFAKTLTKCVSDGIMCNDKLEKYLLQEGIWTQEKEDEKIALESEIRDGLIALATGGILQSEARKIAIKCRSNRIKLIMLTLDRTKLVSFTAESLADSEKTNYLISECTKNSDGTKVFSSFDDFQDKRKTEIALKAENNFYRLYHGLADDFEKNLEENKFLMKYGYVNDDLELVDKEGNYVDVDGNKIVEPEEVKFTEFLEG